MKPRLLDLFCGAGGAARGYQEAGFYVVGVDIEDQPRYAGDEFVQADALEVLGFERGPGVFPFDAIHASPPCQFYSVTGSIFGRQRYSDLIDVVRSLLQTENMPWVIENVPGAPLARQPTLDGRHGVTLCGTMFGLQTYRHRLFESNAALVQPHHPAHLVPCVEMGRRPEPGKFLTIAGKIIGIDEGRRIMGCPWMNQKELSQAIPPAYTEFIGTQLMQALEHAA